MSDHPICPCGSQATYKECCGQYHSGAPAPTPETLMRSRFSAFVQNKTDYEVRPVKALNLAECFVTA